MEIKEQIDQLYYQIGELTHILINNPPLFISEDQRKSLLEYSEYILKQVIELKKSIGEDYSYDEQLLNQL